MKFENWILGVLGRAFAFTYCTLDPVICIYNLPNGHLQNS